MKRITSEEPNIHWGFLDIKDKIVLDLGCARFHSSISTAEWFINNGATKVIGIDLGNEIIDSNQFIYHSLSIDTTQKIKGLIETYKPHIIKADIEGAERYFNEITLEDLGLVNEIAIEYHDNELKGIILQKIAEWGFGIVDTYQLMDIEIERMGVIHAKKQN
jgi:hypothetical protein